MLFAAKRRARTALVVAAVLVGLAVILGGTLELSSALRPSPRVLAMGVAGAVALVMADALAHVVLATGWPTRYLATYTAFIEYFDGQSRWAVVAAGVLAGSEELLFRGVLLQGLSDHAAVPAGVAVGVAGIAFGLAHYVPAPSIARFTIWAVWEGVLLGALFVLSGSLLVAIVAHALHDVIGFRLLAWQREHGVLIPATVRVIDDRW